MENDVLILYLLSIGYHELVDTETNSGVVGCFQFMYTHGIVCGITKDFYNHRYCYHTRLDAVSALRDWQEIDFQGEPKDFIKRKG